MPSNQTKPIIVGSNIKFWCLKLLARPTRRINVMNQTAKTALLVN